MSLLTRSAAKTPSLAYGAAPRVNLLPLGERRRREQRALARRWVATAVAALALVLVAVVGAAVLEHGASSGLRSEQARTNALASRLAAFKDVSQASRDKGAYEGYRTQAMATDVTWMSVIGALRAALPAGTSIGAFDAVVSAGSAANGAASTTGTATPPATGGGTAGGTAGGTGAVLAAASAPAGTAVTVSVQVTGTQPGSQAATVSSFAHVAGVLGVELGSLSSSSAGYTSTTTVYFGPAVLSARYGKVAR